MAKPAPIQRNFSLGFQARYCLALIAGSIVTTLVLYLYLDRGLGEGYFEGLTTLDNLNQSLPLVLLVTFVVQLILILVLTIAINLFVSHKIAGPVYRYEQSLKDIREGDLRRDVRTRDGDQLKSMVDALNGWIHAIRHIYLNVQSVDTELARYLEALERGESPAQEELLLKIAEAKRAAGATDTCDEGRES